MSKKTMFILSLLMTLLMLLAAVSCDNKTQDMSEPGVPAWLLGNFAGLYKGALMTITANQNSLIFDDIDAFDNNTFQGMVENQFNALKNDAMWDASLGGNPFVAGDTSLSPEGDNYIATLMYTEPLLLTPKTGTNASWTDAEITCQDEYTFEFQNEGDFVTATLTQGEISIIGTVTLTSGETIDVNDTKSPIASEIAAYKTTPIITGPVEEYPGAYLSIMPSSDISDIISRPLSNGEIVYSWHPDKIEARYPAGYGMDGVGEMRLWLFGLTIERAPSSVIMAIDVPNPDDIDDPITNYVSTPISLMWNGGNVTATNIPASGLPFVIDGEPLPLVLTITGSGIKGEDAVITPGLFMSSGSLMIQDSPTTEEFIDADAAVTINVIDDKGDLSFSFSGSITLSPGDAIPEDLSNIRWTGLNIASESGNGLTDGAYIDAVTLNGSLGDESIFVVNNIVITGILPK